MIKYCKCGCGYEIVTKLYHKYYGIPEYILGHNPSANMPEALEKRKKRMKENNPMKNPIIAKENALKRKGAERTGEQKENISIGVKEAMKRPEVKEKMKKPKTEEHKEKLSETTKQSWQNGTRKTTWEWTEESKRRQSENLKGNQRRKGTYCSEESKKKIGLVSKKNWQNSEFREKRLNALHKHHIYLDNNDKKSLMLTSSKHLQLHSRAYNYLVEISKIDDYIEWFDKKYSLFKKEEK